MNNGTVAMAKETLSVCDAASLLGVGKTTLYEALGRGEVPHVRIGSRVVIPRRVVERLLDGEQSRLNQSVAKTVGAVR
jgi:excisionase family DNA binding protein